MCFIPLHSSFILENGVYIWGRHWIFQELLAVRACMWTFWVKVYLTNKERSQVGYIHNYMQVWWVEKIIHITILNIYTTYHFLFIHIFNHSLNPHA